MTRNDLVESVKERFNKLTRRDVEQAVVTILDSMGAALSEGRRVEIRGFGSFSVTHRKPREGRNPRSGAIVQIPEKRAPHFRPGKSLRNALLQQDKS